MLAVGGGYFWVTGGRYQDTENANVRQSKVSIASDTAGRIVEANLAENEPVKAGDVLFRDRSGALPHRAGAGRRGTCRGAARRRAVARRLQPGGGAGAHGQPTRSTI